MQLSSKNQQQVKYFVAKLAYYFACSKAFYELNAGTVLNDLHIKCFPFIKALKAGFLLKFNQSLSAKF